MKENEQMFLDDLADVVLQLAQHHGIISDFTKEGIIEQVTQTFLTLCYTELGKDEYMRITKTNMDFIVSMGLFKASDKGAMQ